MRRTMAVILAAATVLLGLGGCYFAPGNPRVHSLASALAKLPGVDEAEGSWTPGNITYAPAASIYVDLDPSIEPEQLLAVTERWAQDADFGKVNSRLSLDLDGPDSSSSITIDQTDLDEGYITDLLPVWLTLANNYESVTAGAGNDGPSLSLRISGMETPSDAAETIADIADVGGELAASSWSIAPLVDDDVLDRTGVEVSTSDGLPDADARAVLAGLDDAYRFASALGEVTVEFETAHPDASASTADYRIAVQLSPTDLRNTPSNQLNDVLLESTSWQSTLRFADAISADHRILATFSLYSNPEFATLVSFDCSGSNDAGDSDFTAELWQYWTATTAAAGCG